MTVELIKRSEKTEPKRNDLEPERIASFIGIACTTQSLTNIVINKTDCKIILASAQEPIH